MKINWLAIDLTNPLIFDCIKARTMAFLKKHWILLILTLMLIAAMGLVVFRCERLNHGKQGGSLGSLRANNSAVVDPVAVPGTPATSPATIADILTDPTTLGAILTAVLSALGMLWKAMQKKDVQGVIAAVGDGAKTIESLKDSLSHGVPFTPSVETLAADIAAARYSDAPVASEARAIAVKLIEKYVITVRP